MPKQTGFRIFGNELRRDDGYIDVTVAGADVTGEIYLEEVNGDGSWSMGHDELKSLKEDELIIGSDNIPVPDHTMWTTLTKIGETRAAVDINNFVDARLRDSAKNLFQALIEVGK